MNEETIERFGAAVSGRYSVVRELGRGGMAFVLLAHDPRHEREVAIKVLLPELAALLGAERFLAEIRTTASLQHPHVLPLFDSGEAGGFLYYVMPFVTGESLRDRLQRERQLPVDEAVGITKAVAHALDYAHREGVVHRDIKPANILIQEGQPVVADFGIALAVSASGGARLTETGLSLGTPQYMSPEQATVDHTPGPASDVYSLGCVLYEMLTGEPPYTGSSPQAILGKIIAATPALPREQRPSVPGHVEAALLRSLEKLPADRFLTAGAFASALDDRTLSHPRQAAAGAEAKSTSPWIAQRPSQVAVAAVALLVAALTTVILQPPSATAPRPVARLVLAEEHGSGGFALSDDGVWLASRPVGEEPIRLRRLDTEGYREILAAVGAGPVGFSPDSRWLLVAGPEGLLRVPVEGGSPIRISEIGRGGADWSDEGLIFFLALDGGYTVPWNGGEFERVLDEGSITARRPRFLPDGRHVLYTRHSTPGDPSAEVRVLDLETGVTRAVVDDGFGAEYVGTGHLLFARASQALFAVPFDPARARLTGDPVQVLDSMIVVPPSARYAVSEAGLIVFRRGATLSSPGGRLALVEPTGEAELLPVRTNSVAVQRIAPDGRRIAYLRGSDVFVYDRVSGVTTSVSPEDDPSIAPLWTPDGRLVITSFGGDRPGTTLFSVAATTGATPVELFRDSTSLLLALDSDPNGTAMLLQAGDPAEPAGFDLVILKLEADTSLVPYLSSDWREALGSISPDGRWVAYLSDETGGERVYVRSFPVPGPRFEVSRQDIRRGLMLPPAWAGDGGALYWQTSDSIMMADVRLEPDFDAGPPRLLFRGNYTGGVEVAGDGRLLLVASEPVVTEAASALQRTILIVNWLEELKRRMSTGS